MPLENSDQIHEGFIDFVKAFDRVGTIELKPERYMDLYKPC